MHLIPALTHTDLYDLRVFMHSLQQAKVLMGAKWCKQYIQGQEVCV